MFFTLTNKSYLGLFGDPFFWGGIVVALGVTAAA